MSEFTFLTAEQCFGKNQLNILEKRGTKAAISDFSILLGGYVADKVHVDGDYSLEGRIGEYWTKSEERNNEVQTISEQECGDCADADLRYVGARPVLQFSSIDKIRTNEVSEHRAKDDILEVEYGYYPQKAVSKNMQTRLEREYSLSKIRKTGNEYTTDSRAGEDYTSSFLAQKHEEYEYNGKRYVRVEANAFYGEEGFTLFQ